MINLEKVPNTTDAEMATESESESAPAIAAEAIANPIASTAATVESKDEASGGGLAVWIERLELAKAVIINLVILCVISSVCFVFYREWQREPVIIEPLVVPDSFTQQGYSGSVLANRLMDQVSANREASYNRLPDNQKYLFPVEVTNADSADTLKVDIPETGMSLNIIIQYIRKMRGKETRINGDLVGDKDQLEFTIRVNGKPKIVKGNLKSLDVNLAELAEHIIENTQPYFLALNYYGKKDYDRALELVQKTLSNKDTRDDSFAYDLWGGILTRKKQYEKAIEKYSESIKINPHNDSPYIGLGFVYYQGYKNYDGAIESYQKVIKRNPKNYSAYNDLALILAEKGDTKAAIESYKKAILANSEYANAYYNLGLIYLGTNDFKQAILQFRKIIDLPYNAGNYFNAYNGLCYSLSQIQHYEEAVSNCELAIKIKPEDDNIYDTLGTVYVAQKNLPKALANYQKAVGFNPDNSEAQQHLAEVFAMTGRCNDANTHLNLALKVDSSVDKKGVESFCKGSEKPNPQDKKKATL
jgi:tetratricopeptide (TPR) repeat protein